MKTRNHHHLLLAIMAAALLFTACSDDGEEDAGPAVGVVDQDSDGSSTAAAADEPRPAPKPEQQITSLLAGDAQGITVGGYVFEVDGLYVLCETLTESDPPECSGQSIEITNGDVLDPIIFVGEPGSQYSDAEVVMTGDVIDGRLTIG